MSLIKKLLGSLHSVFDKDPKTFTAFSIIGQEPFIWSISDYTLSVTVPTMPDNSFTIDLSTISLDTLAATINAQPGFSIKTPFGLPSLLVLFTDGGLSNYLTTSNSDDALSLSITPAVNNGALMASILIDGSSNGDTVSVADLLAYESILYAYLDTVGRELQAAAAQIPNAIAQMAVPSAADFWLDELGSYYAVQRVPGEPDSIYGPRIIAEVLRPRGNNVAIEQAILTATGLSASVTDAPVRAFGTPNRNGATLFDGSAVHKSVGGLAYGYFDVNYQFDLAGGEDVNGFAARVRSLIEKFRDAGTYLRQFTFSGALYDTVPRNQTDFLSLAASEVGLSETYDTATVAKESTKISVLLPTQDAYPDVAASHYYNGVYRYDGSITYLPPNETLMLNVTYANQRNGRYKRNGSITYGRGVGGPETL